MALFYAYVDCIGALWSKCLTIGVWKRVCFYGVSEYMHQQHRRAKFYHRGPFLPIFLVTHTAMLMYNCWICSYFGLYVHHLLPLMCWLQRLTVHSTSGANPCAAAIVIISVQISYTYNILIMLITSDSYIVHMSCSSYVRAWPWSPIGYRLEIAMEHIAMVRNASERYSTHWYILYYLRDE